MTLVSNVLFGVAGACVVGVITFFLLGVPMIGGLFALLGALAAYQALEARS